MGTGILFISLQIMDLFLLISKDNKQKFEIKLMFKLVITYCYLKLSHTFTEIDLNTYKVRRVLTFWFES